MEIAFTPGIIECQQLFQITKSHILKAVEDPNQKQAIDVNGLRLEFYTNEEEAGYTILVCAHKENEKLLLDSTFKVFPTLITETHALEPLELLRQLALKFGLVMHFGPEATRFLVHRVRPMPAGSNQTPLIGVSNPGNHFPLQRFFLKIDQANGMNLINCSLAYCIDLNTYIAWLMDEQENRAGSPIVEEAELSNREFARQCRIMLEEQLFSLDWLLDERNKNHPAHYQWKLCENIINGTPLGFERQDENVAKVGRILLDMVVLQELLIRDTNQRKHIVINKLIDDENALNNVLARLRDPQTYDDCLLELVMGAWHASRGHNVVFLKPQQQQRTPDLLISGHPFVHPVIIECKHIVTDSIQTSNKRKTKLNTIIYRAHRQIEELFADKKCFGVVVVDVSTPLGLKRTSDDVVPDIINGIERTIKNILRDKDRSIGAVIVLWDDYMEFGDRKRASFYGVRRRLIRIDHKNPISPIPEDLPLFEGFTAEFWMRWG